MPAWAGQEGGLKRLTGVEWRQDGSFWGVGRVAFEADWVWEGVGLAVAV